MRQDPHSIAGGDPSVTMTNDKISGPSASIKVHLGCRRGYCNIYVEAVSRTTGGLEKEPKLLGAAGYGLCSGTELYCMNPFSARRDQCV